MVRLVSVMCYVLCVICFRLVSVMCSKCHLFQYGGIVRLVSVMFMCHGKKNIL